MAVEAGEMFVRLIERGLTQMDEQDNGLPRIRRIPELWRGLSCEATLASIITNMQAEAREAIKGVRRPRETA